MANLTEHVILNKWDNDINEAIVSVGGDTTGSAGLPDYARIIREQLVARGVNPDVKPGEEFILQADSYIIEPTSEGHDEYRTEYAAGIKTGLIPGHLYLRLCLAIKDIEPTYIDLSRISGGIVDIDEIVNLLLNNQSFIDTLKGETIHEITQEVTIIQQEISVVQEQIAAIQDTKVDKEIYNQSQIEIYNQIETMVDKKEVEEIIIEIVGGNDNGINVDELNWD